jgi:adenylyltransferase/sulfurtransferase
MPNPLSAVLGKVGYVVLVVALLAVAANAAGLLAPSPAGGVMDAQTLRAQMTNKSDIFLLDVREPDEYTDGHIDGATLIPLGSLQSRVSELPKDRPIVVYCRSGRRSAEAVSQLRALGFDRAVNLTGGYTRWVAEKASK